MKAGPGGGTKGVEVLVNEGEIIGLGESRIASCRRVNDFSRVEVGRSDGVAELVADTTTNQLACDVCTRAARLVGDSFTLPVKGSQP